jgi:hypothetical protein
MIRKYPLMNEYWADKRAKAHRIQVPAYILASMSTGLHTVGSLRCYEDIPHENKWSVGHRFQIASRKADMAVFIGFELPQHRSGMISTSPNQ